MREIHIKRREYDEKDFIKRNAAESDCKTEIQESCKVYFDDQLAAVLIYDVDFPDETRQAVLGLKSWAKGFRGSGIKTETIAIGNQPRVPARSKEACFCSALENKEPAAHHSVLRRAPEGQKLYEQHCPEVFNKHLTWVQENIRSEWTIPGSVFTSGVINKNCSMAYHRDRGNIKDGWSIMYVLKNHMSGANLNVIDFDAKLFLPDRSLLIFNGQNYMHGVTPMVKTKPDGYRYSIVFYTLAGMQQCLAPADELRRAQIMRTKREMRRAGLINE